MNASENVRLASVLYRDQVAFSVIGWPFMSRPCEFIWLGALSRAEAAARVANAPIYLGKDRT